MKRFLSLVIALIGFVATGATITGPVLLSYSNSPYVGPILFRPLSTPLPYTPNLITGGDFTVRPATNGTFSVELSPGNYRVTVGADKAFVIDVPTNAATYTLLERITNSLAWNSAISPRTNSYNIANNTIEGVVRTYTTQASPVVWTTNDWAAMATYLGQYTYTNIAQMVSAPAPLQSPILVKVLGYFNAHDGGGGDFLWDATRNTITNLGTVFQSPSPNGRYFALFNDGGRPIMVNRFGAIPDDQLEDTGAIKAAVAYAESTGSGYSLYAPAGAYLVSEPIKLKKCELFGVRTHQSRVVSEGNTIFKTVNWNTSLHREVFDIDPDGASTGAPWLHDIEIESSRTNTITKIPITAVSSRLSFTIAETPTLQTGNQTNFYPYLNWAFFFSPQGNYMGGGTVIGAVQSGPNWTITMTDGDDFYATPAGTGGMLTTACYVTFAPLTTIGGADRSDPTQVGVAGVRMRGSLSAKVENVGTYDTWVGFAFSPASVTSFHWIKDTAAWRNSFAGYASAVRSYQGAYDYSGDGVLFASGFSPSFDITVDNKGYSAGMFGFYNLPIASGYDQIWSDGYVVGMQSDLLSGIAIDRAKLDNCYRHGLVTLDALYDLGFSTGVSIGALDIRGLVSTSDTIPLPNGRAIWMRGKTYPAEIWAGTLTVMLAANQRFDYAIDITNSSANSLTIGRMMTGAGFTNWIPATSRLPVLFSSAYGSTNAAVGWSYNNAVQKNLGASISLANNGTNRLTINTSGVTGHSADGTKTTFVAGDTTFVARGGDTNVYNRTSQNGVYIGKRSTGEATDYSGAFLLESGDSGNVSMHVRAAGGTAIFDGLSSTGTYASPGALTGDISMVSFGARAYDGSAYNTAARLQFLSSGTHSATNRGSYARIETTPFGSTSRSTFYTFSNDGTITVPKGIEFGSAGTQDRFGGGSPEGVVFADKGSTWRRTDGGASTIFYVKETGIGLNTGWVALGPPGAGGVAASRQILTTHSLTGGGDLSTDRTLSLVNDTASPGANKVYGTDGSGVRGWKNDPTGGGGVSDGDKGDITISGSGTVYTVDAGVVSLAKLANLAQDQFIGRVTASTGVPETATITAAARTVLDDTTTSAMRSTLGLSIGTDVQAIDAELTSIAGLTSAADRVPYYTGSGTAALATFTAAGRALVDDADATAQRTTLGLGTVATESTVPIAKGGTGQTTASAANDALQGAETTVASATTTDLGAVTSDKVSITGTTTITGFGTVAAGVKREGRFTGALTLTHNATSLILPGNASISTAAGDRFQAYSLGSGNWVVSSYTKADGTAVVGGSGSVATDTIWDAAGDLVVGTGANTAARLAPPTQLSGSTLYYGPSGVEWVNPATHYTYRNDFLTSSTITTDWGNNSSGGSTSFYNSETGAVGILAVLTGTGTTGYRHQFLGGNNAFFLGNGRTIITWKVRLQNLSDATDTFTAYVGLYDHWSTVVDGVWFEYSHGVNSGKWECKVSDNSAQTITDSGVTATTSLTTFLIDVNAGATEAKFYINGSLVHTESGANIPQTARSSNIGWGITKSAGTNTRGFNADYLDIYVKY